jgi:hypothetical protein
MDAMYLLHLPGEGVERRHRSGPMLYDGGYVCSCANQAIGEYKEKQIVQCDHVFARLARGGVERHGDVY